MVPQHLRTPVVNFSTTTNVTHVHIAVPQGINDELDLKAVITLDLKAVKILDLKAVIIFDLKICYNIGFRSC